MERLVFYKFFKDFTNFFLSIILSIAVIVWVIQAVNYLDLVAEDGHGFKIYFLYTLYTLPKIISRILPFIFFISIFFLLINTEEKNELQIFWLNGIKKIDFIKFISKFSLFYLLVLSLLNTVIVPYFQDSARSFIRSSDLDYFTSLINEKKFNDTVSDLTIYVNEISEDGKYKNIYLKDKVDEFSSQIIFAKSGEIKKINNANILSLNDGKIMNQTIARYKLLNIYFKADNNFEFTTKSGKILDAINNHDFEYAQKKFNENKNRNTLVVSDISDLEFPDNNKDSFSNIQSIDSYYNYKISKISNFRDSKLNIINFKNTEFNLSKYKTTTITSPKIQEYGTDVLIKCYLSLKKNPSKEFTILNKYICRNEIFKEIKQEILKRFITPLYIPILALISCLLLLKSKDQPGFLKQKFIVFFISLSVIIFSEIITRYAGLNIISGIVFSIMPVIIGLTIYIYLNSQLNKNVY